MGSTMPRDHDTEVPSCTHSAPGKDSQMGLEDGVVALVRRDRHSHVLSGPQSRCSEPIRHIGTKPAAMALGGFAGDGVRELLGGGVILWTLSVHRAITCDQLSVRLCVPKTFFG